MMGEHTAVEEARKRESDLSSQIDAVRSFNRFYTRQIGLLREGLLRSPFSLPEARVVYELAQRPEPTAAELARALDLDQAYLSRLLRGFRERGLLTTRPSEEDGRVSLLSLTDAGRRAFQELDEASAEEVAGMLHELTSEGREELVVAMRTIQRLLGGEDGASMEPYLLRIPRAGDLGWVVARHGVLYRDEYGWDERFEGLVAGVVADFVRGFDPRWERCWIAERQGRNVGSVFLMRDRERPGIARLRLLLVEPEARGLGIGTRLVGECTRFAREAGYRAVTLWTNDVLDAARRIYEREGYYLVKEERHASFGPELVGQTWELDL